MRRPLPKLHGFQVEDLKRQVKARTICNNLPLGAGKTLINLACIQVCIDMGLADTAIVVTKKSTIPTAWEGAIHKFFPHLSYKVCHGDISRKKREAIWADSDIPDLYICNYEAMTNKLDGAYMAALVRNHRVVLIADEAHYLRNVETLRHSAWVGLADRAVRVIPTTATPVQTSPLDLYGMLSALRFPGLPSRRAWLLKWCNCKVIQIPVPMSRRGYREELIPVSFKRHKLADLRPILTNWFIRRSPDLIKLPPLVDETRLIDLTASERKAYMEAEGELARATDAYKGDEPALRAALYSALSATSELRAICSGKRAEGIPAKDEELMSMLPEMTADGQKVVVYSPYSQTVERLIDNCSRAFPEWRFVRITGSDSASSRGRSVRRLIEDDSVKVLFMTDAGAEGIDGLQEKCSRMVFFDRTYNPAQEDQILGRVYRQGQKSSVVCIRFLAAGTIEEKIEQTLLRRRDVMDAVDHLSRQELTDVARSLLSARAGPGKKVGR